MQTLKCLLVVRKRFLMRYRNLKDFINSNQTQFMFYALDNHSDDALILIILYRGQERIFSSTGTYTDHVDPTLNQIQSLFKRWLNFRHILPREFMASNQMKPLYDICTIVSVVCNMQIEIRSTFPIKIESRFPGFVVINYSCYNFPYLSSHQSSAI